MKQKGAEEFVERLSAALAGKEAAAQVQIDPLLAQAGGCGRMSCDAMLGQAVREG